MPSIRHFGLIDPTNEISEIDAIERYTLTGETGELYTVHILDKV